MNDKLKMLALMAREAHWVGYTDRDIRTIGRALGLSEAEVSDAAQSLVSQGLVVLVGKGRYRMLPPGIEAALRAIAAGNVEDQALTENDWDLLAAYTDGHLNYLISHSDGIYSFLPNDPDTSVQAGGYQAISEERARELISDPSNVFSGGERARPLNVLYRNESKISELGLTGTAT